MTLEKFKVAHEAKRQQQQLNHQARKAMVVARARPIFERFGIRQAVLFGSLAQGNSSEHSDVDLLVTPLGAAQYWERERLVARRFSETTELLHEQAEVLLAKLDALQAE